MVMHDELRAGKGRAGVYDGCRQSDAIFAVDAGAVAICACTKRKIVNRIAKFASI